MKTMVIFFFPKLYIKKEISLYCCINRIEGVYINGMDEIRQHIYR